MFLHIVSNPSFPAFSRYALGNDVVGRETLGSTIHGQSGDVDVARDRLVLAASRLGVSVGDAEELKVRVDVDFIA